MAELRLYDPHSNQVKIHQSQARNRVVVAGRRFGKSALALNEAIARAAQIPKQICWIILPLYRQAKEIYWIDPDMTQYFMPLVNAGICKADKSELSLHFKQTDSWVRLKGSDNYDSLRGSGLDLVIWDEVADVKQEAFDTIEPALADSPDHRMLYIGTPKGLNWFHDFALKGDHGKVISSFGKPIKQHKDWQTWHFTSYDNMAWPEGSRERRTFVEYIDEKKREAEERGRLPFWYQEYGASFEESAGRFFPTWFFKTHVYNGTIIPRPGFTIFETIDWGRSSPFAWYAHIIKPEEYLDPKTLDKITFNRIFTFAELYDTQKSPQEWSAEILKMRAKFKYKQPKIIYADPSMFNPLSDGSASIVKQMNQGFDSLSNVKQIWAEGSRRRPPRWAAMDDWMRIAIDDLPYWMITKDCPNLIRTIPMMEPDENNIEDLNTLLEDHACFGSSTPILTNKGYIPIIDVNIGDKVWTPIGWSKVIDKIERRDILTTFQGMRVTKNHPFLTQDGFLPLKDLTGKEKLWNVYISKGNRTGDIRIRQDFPIRAILSVVQRKLEADNLHYIKQSGFSLTAFLQNALIFITKTKTLLITLLKILRWSLLPNTLRNTFCLLEKQLRSVDSLVKRKLGNGIKARPVKNGTQRTARRRGKRESLLLRLANCVRSLTTPSKVTPDFAATTTEWPSTDGKSRVINLKTDTGIFIARTVAVSNCDSVSYGIPYIKWTDTSVGTVARPTRKNLPTKYQNLIDPSSFE